MDLQDERYQRIVQALAKDPELSLEETVDEVIMLGGEAMLDVRNDYNVTEGVWNKHLDMRFFVSLEGGAPKEIKTPVATAMLRDALGRARLELHTTHNEWLTAIHDGFGVIHKKK